MSEIEEYRQTVRKWLEENAPESLRGKAGDITSGYWGGKKTPLPFPDSRAWTDMMAEERVDGSHVAQGIRRGRTVQKGK